MATIASLRVDLIGSSAAFRSEMVKGQRQANVSLGAIQKQAEGVRLAFQDMRRALVGFAALDIAKRGLDSLLDSQVKMQAIHYTLLAATGSAQQAGAAFDFVRAESEKLGLSLEPTAEGFARLSASATALHVPMQQQKDLFDAFAKASTTLHLSTDNSNRALLALEQMFAKGKVQAQELRLQLGQAIPGAAARFQQATMQMVKGTDLQGKSFDQLLKDGDLYTDKFLPALVQALQESSRGWESASDSLNAQLNRLRTAWFNLKADVSGGLFNDAAIESAKFMASHLDALANVAGVAAGVVGARFAGKGLAAGAGAVSDLRGLTAARIADAQATAMSAERELALASAQASSAAASRAKTTALIASLKQTLTTDLGEKERTATLNRLGAATTRLVGENIAYRDSLASLSVAQQAAKLSEAELAAARTATTVGTAARGLGSFALGLVGGPWGAAALAIGAVAYGVYKLKAAQVAYDNQTKEMESTVGDMTEKLKGLADAYKDVSSQATAGNLSSALADSGNAAFELIQRRAELQAKLQQAQSVPQQTFVNTGSANALQAYVMAQGSNAAKKYADEIAAINAQLRDMDVQQNRVAQDLAQRLVQVMGSDVPDAIQRMVRAAANGKGAAQALMAELANIPALQKYIQLLDQYSGKIDEVSAKWSAQAASLKESNDKAQLGAAGALTKQFADTVQSVEFQSQTIEKQTEAINNYYAALGQIKRQDSIDAAQKAMQRAQQQAEQNKQAFDSLTNSQNAQLQSLRQELDGSAKLSQAQRDLNLMLQGGDTAFRKLSASEKSEAIAKQRQIVTLTQESAARKQATRDAEAYAIVQQNLARIAQQQARERDDSLSAVGLGEQSAQRLAKMRDIRRQYDDLMAQAGRSATRGDISQTEYANEIAAYQSQLDTQLKATQNYYAELDQLRGNWVNGATSAFDDYIAKASDVSNQFHDLFADAFSGIEDAMANFVTTGKLNFEDLGNSIISTLVKIETRILISKVLTSILGAFATGPSGYNMGYFGSYSQSATDATAASSVNYIMGGRANGGPVAGGSLYEVAEGGKPELLTSGSHTYLMMGSQGGHVTPAIKGGAGGSGGGTTVIVENHSDQQAQVQQSQDGNGGDIIRVIVGKAVSEVNSQIARGGSTYKTLQQTFGLNRRGVPVAG